MKSVPRMIAAAPCATRRLVAVTLAVAASFATAPARADIANSDSVYLIGEFVDPVCAFQHGMQGVAQKQCALVRGRVEQGVYFLDVRGRRIYTVIGQTHWQDPKVGFLDALGDTFAVRARIWRRYGQAAIAITDAWPWRAQPEPVYPLWPWRWEWSVLLGCGILMLLQLLAVGPLRRRLGAPTGRVEWGRVALFASAMLVVLVSLDGPLHDLSDLYLFSTHMVQHLLLAQVFPLLFLTGLPPWLTRRLLRPAPVRRTWSFLAGVPTGFALYTLVFSMWHVPVLYNLMMREHGFHIVMHLMVMGTATLMWWPILGGEAVERPLAEPAQLLYLFLLSTPMMAVAAMLVFASQPLYEWYALAPRIWGMGALEDQRLGALIMWVPGSLFWWGVMSVVYFRWASRERRGDHDPLIRGAL